MEQDLICSDHQMRRGSEKRYVSPGPNHHPVKKIPVARRLVSLLQHKPLITTGDFIQIMAKNEEIAQKYSGQNESF
jgi:hypothetical protein